MIKLFVYIFIIYAIYTLYCNMIYDLSIYDIDSQQQNQQNQQIQVQHNVQGYEKNIETATDAKFKKKPTILPIPRYNYRDLVAPSALSQIS